MVLYDSMDFVKVDPYRLSWEPVVAT